MNFSQDPLIASEMFSLGGPRAVRAYPSGESMGDSGYLLSLEARWDWSAMRGPGAFLDYWQWYGFYDAGTAEVNDTAGTTYTLAGVGGGLRFGMEGQYSFDASYAKQAGGDDPADTESGDDQFWVQIVKHFN